jgi:integrase
MYANIAVGRRGRPLSPSTIRRPEYVTRHFQALAKRSGLPAIRLHDLRHTNASLALEAGVEMKVVSERLGHSQIPVTADLYIHVSNAVGGRGGSDRRGLEPIQPCSSYRIPTADPRKRPSERW